MGGHPGIAKIRTFITKANWSNNTAYWDGIEEPTSGKSGIAGCLSSPNNAFGTIPALSLIIALYDENSKLCFINSGGIQLLSNITAFNQFNQIPPDKLMKDKNKDLRAVYVCLKPLFEHLKSIEK